MFVSYKKSFTTKKNLKTIFMAANNGNNSLSALTQGGGMNNTSYGAGTVATSAVGGGSGSAMLLETGYMETAVNPVVQFQYDNSGVGNTQQKIIFGSVISQTDDFNFWATGASAADDTVIKDQNGVGVQFTQGFGKLVSSKAIIISKIKVFGTNNDSQLKQNFLYRQLQYDGTIKDTQANIAYTVEMTDQRTDLVVMPTFFLLDSQYFLQYNALATKVFSVFFDIEAANMVETFKELPKFA